jgi:hypothetical protein
VKAPALRVRLDAQGDRRSGYRWPWRSTLAGEIGGALRLHHEHNGMDRTKATVKAPGGGSGYPSTRPEIGATAGRWLSMLAGKIGRRSLVAPRAHRNGPHPGRR